MGFQVTALGFPSASTCLPTGYSIVLGSRRRPIRRQTVSFAVQLTDVQPSLLCGSPGSQDHYLEFLENVSHSGQNFSICKNAASLTPSNALPSLNFFITLIQVEKE